MAVVPEAQVEVREVPEVAVQPKVAEVEGVWPMPHPLRVGALAVLTPLIQT